MAKAPGKPTPPRAQAEKDVRDIWGEGFAEFFGFGELRPVPDSTPASRDVTAGAKPAAKPKTQARKG